MNQIQTRAEPTPQTQISISKRECMLAHRLQSTAVPRTASLLRHRSHRCLERTPEARPIPKSCTEKMTTKYTSLCPHAVAESVAPAHVATVGVASGAGPSSRSAAAANEGAKRTTSGSPEVAAVAGEPWMDEVRQDALNVITDSTNVLQVPTTQLAKIAKINIELKFVELTAS